MRVYGTTEAVRTTPGPSARRTATGNFTVPEQEPQSTPAPAAALRTVGGIDALLALQGVEDPLERRRRAIGHGRSALDILDEIKLKLLDGSLDQSTLQRLKSAATSLKLGSGDENLDGVLAEIELRAEVELAKAGVR
jgi:hypothetical protein